jgi:hypothetical protein
MVGADMGIVNWRDIWRLAFEAAAPSRIESVEGRVYGLPMEIQGGFLRVC